MFTTVQFVILQKTPPLVVDEKSKASENLALATRVSSSLSRTL
jgi:hypothetical protein